MKQIKEIFRRSSSLWLIMELILVTFACWWAFDPVLVTGTVIRMNPGFDVDRMVKLNVASTVTRLDIEEQQITTIPDEEERLLQKVQELEDVELAYRAVFGPLGVGTMAGQPTSTMTATPFMLVNMNS